MSVVAELQDRRVKGILNACVGVLKGFLSAINVVVYWRHVR